MANWIRLRIILKDDLKIQSRGDIYDIAGRLRNVLENRRTVEKTYLEEFNMEKKKVTCPLCGSNLCLIYPGIFILHHLSKKDKKFYDVKRQALDDFIKERMKEYKEKLVKEEK